jgi:hypothetical protein
MGVGGEMNLIETEAEKKMGRIVNYVTIHNVFDPTKRIQCEAIVDTGASLMVLPRAWKDRLGQLEQTRIVELELASQQKIRGEGCGPVSLQLEGFHPIFTEVIFLEMTPMDGDYEPLIGYIVLEQSMVAVDMLGHRLIALKHMDLK